MPALSCAGAQLSRRPASLLATVNSLLIARTSRACCCASWDPSPAHRHSPRWDDQAGCADPQRSATSSSNVDDHSEGESFLGQTPHAASGDPSGGDDHEMRAARISRVRCNWGARHVFVGVMGEQRISRAKIGGGNTVLPK